ncbi:MAG: NAD(P)-binding domain-containing protein [Gammaproteobacteria bacterium]|nr:NAD(P)-binding domain-containing protein [Gammaproteobacteria bacterium]
MKNVDIIIIGGGPAGMISAIQLKRYGITALLFEPNRMGGLLWNANLVENYPGFPEGIPGPQLVEKFSNHFESLSLQHTPQRVSRIDFQGDYFVVTTDQQDYASRAVIVATGTRPINFPGDFIPNKASEYIFYEVAPLLNVEGQHIAIIGAGDAAFDYALNLSRKNHVIILNRTREIKALPLLVERCAKIQHIQYYQDMPVSEIFTNEDGLILRTVQDEVPYFEVNLLIGAIGREENLPPMSDQLRIKSASLVDSGRLHFVGDVQNGIYRQTAIAIGDGLKAAMKVYQFLKE